MIAGVIPRLQSPLEIAVEHLVRLLAWSAADHLDPRLLEDRLSPLTHTAGDYESHTLFFEPARQ